MDPLISASRRLKLLAKVGHPGPCPFSALRNCGNRDNKRPLLSDLRDFGVVEQDADVVLFLFRSEVYDPDTDEKGIAELLVRKHRNGSIVDRRLGFVNRFARFTDLVMSDQAL